jgi:hypothetical protein
MPLCSSQNRSLQASTALQPRQSLQMATKNARKPVPYYDEPEKEHDNIASLTDASTQPTMADLLAAIDKLTDKITALDSRYRWANPPPKPLSIEWGWKTYPARFAMWINMPLSSICLVLALPQILPLPLVPVAIYYGLSWILILPICLWYEEQYYPWWTPRYDEPG